MENWAAVHRLKEIAHGGRPLEGYAPVVAATAQRAGTWRGAACNSFAGLSSASGLASFRPAGRRRCKQRQTMGEGTTERSPPAPARDSWQFHRFGASVAPSALESQTKKP
jgi:hypothetical protein